MQADATELSKDGTIGFHFKLHGSKHTFEAQTAPERNGWFVAVEAAIEEAKGKKDEIVASDSYKEQLEKLGKLAFIYFSAGRVVSQNNKWLHSLVPAAQTH